MLLNTNQNFPQNILQYSASAYDDDFNVYGRVRSFPRALRFLEDNCFTYNEYLDFTYEFNTPEFINIMATLGDIYGSSEQIFIEHHEYLLVAVVIVNTQETKTISFTLFTRTTNTVSVKDTITTALQKYIKPLNSVKVSWAVRIKNEMQFIPVSNLISEIVHQEAYPFIPDMDKFVEDYLKSSSNVLVLIGPPGTGKTRFIKHIVKKMSQKNKRSPRILFTMDEKCFGDDYLFTTFLTDNFDALILEDIDIHLKSRKDGNTTMHKLLGSSDGFIQTNKKIILSTNLTSTKNIDEALLRRGRCFSIIESRKLNFVEAKALQKKLGKKTLLPSLQDDFTLAELYNDN